MLKRAQRRRGRPAAAEAATTVEPLEGRRLFCFDIHGGLDLVGPLSGASQSATIAPSGHDWRIDAFSGGRSSPAVTSTEDSLVRAEVEPEPAPPEPIVLRAPADTYVRDGSTYAGTNFGSSTQLQVKKGATGWNREAYLRFDLAAVSSAASATLRLFGRLDNTSAPSVPFTVFNSADTTWSESAMTWNTKLTGGTTVHGSGTVAGTTGAWHEVDLSGFVRDELAAGRQAVTLVIRTSVTSPSNILFDSDEAANPPELVVQPGVGTPPPPPPPPPPDGPAVTAVLLMNADTDQPIGELTPGMTIDYATLPTRNLNVVAEVGSGVESVRFGLDGSPAYATESAAPYALAGDVAGNLSAWTLDAGAHTLTVTPFAADGAAGESGTPRVIDFTIIDDDDTGGGTPVVTPGGTFAWVAAKSAPVPRVEAQGIAVDGKLYVFGGYTNTAIQATRRSDVYNPATNAWQRLADLPEAITHAGIAADGRDIYLAGGFVGNHPGPDTAKVWRYDIDANSFHAVANLPGGRGGGALVRVGRELHFFGGADWPSGAGSIARDFGDHWVLDLDDPDGWVAKATMPNARNHVSGAALGGKVYAIGGQHLSNETSGNQTSVHRYDPATNAWTTVASLPKALGHTTHSTFVRNGRIVVMAGLTQNSTASNAVYEYDPASNSWAALPNAPAAVQSPVAAYVNGNLIFTGGAPDSGGPTTATHIGTLDGRWAKGKSAPVALGETAAGIINNKLYLVGEGSSQTFAYNIATGSWTSGLKSRPHVGDHHAAEVVNGKLYLFGGFNGSSSGKVQIYNPATNTWSLGASMPFSTGSASSAVIDGKVYVAGGIVNFQPNIGGQTTTQAAVYDPVANSWRSIASMPRGVNHAASATDGDRLYVFGGRDGNGVVLNGFATVQVYDPATNTWRSSDNAGSGLAPIPRGRGGMGKAVFANGEFYVMGGETKDGAGATTNRVYSRVDVYDPAANSWRAAPAMPTPRHGIFPLLHAGRIYVAAGGTRAGFSQSTALEILDAT